ncbi:MAG: hypothetical protein ACFB16_08635 [Phormidesmis sp.]
MIRIARAALIKHKLSSRKGKAQGLSSLAVAVLFLSGMTVPAIAQTLESKKHTAATPSATPNSNEAFPESAQQSPQLEAEIERLIAQLINEEIQHWSPAQKDALQTMKALELKEGDLVALVGPSADELHNKAKTDKKLAQKLSQLNAAGISNEEALKLAPMVLLSRYLFNIGRAALWGGVVSAIHSADLDYPALLGALTSGDTAQFTSLLSEGLSSQNSFTTLVSSAATFACGSATLDFTPRLCSRFASGMQKIFSRIERSERSSATRPTARPTGDADAPSARTPRPSLRTPRPASDRTESNSTRSRLLQTLSTPLAAE